MGDKKKLELSAFLKDLILQTRQYTPITTNQSQKAKEIQAMMVAPCQISALWFKNAKNIDFQAFLITHNPKYKDLEINIIGPIIIESNESYNTIEQRLTKNHLFRFVGKETDISNLKSEWVKILRSLVSNLSLYFNIPSEIKFKFYLGKFHDNFQYFSCIRKKSWYGCSDYGIAFCFDYDLLVLCACTPSLKETAPFFG